MTNDAIEAIVKDVFEFIDEEFFSITPGERKDLGKFLRERLLAEPDQPRDLPDSIKEALNSGDGVYRP